METNLWRKLTLDWPCALGDWLRRVFIVELADFLNRLTFRRAVFLVGMIVLVIAFAQVFAAGDAMLFAADAMTYFDIAAAIMLVAVKGRAYQASRIIARQAVTAAQGLSKAVVRYRNETRQRRNANALQRRRARDNPKQSDDEPAGLPWADMPEAFA